MLTSDSTEPTPPLKRHISLQALSREHMGGLILARDLIQTAASDQAARLRSINRFVESWTKEIRAHFDDEERMLLPLTRDPVMRERLLSEHDSLRRLAARCTQDPHVVAAEPSTIQSLGQLLHDHIRWEERVYFEAVQKEHPEALVLLVEYSRLIQARRPGARPRHTLDGWNPGPSG